MRKFWHYLKKANLEFIREGRVGPHKFDYVSNKYKVTIDVLNDFYYGNPNVYDDDELLKVQIRNRRKQETKMEKVMSVGWTPLVVWESDIMKNTSKGCVENIIRLIKR